MSPFSCCSWPNVHVLSKPSASDWDPRGDKRWRIDGIPSSQASRTCFYFYLQTTWEPTLQTFKEYLALASERAWPANIQSALSSKCSSRDTRAKRVCLIPGNKCQLLLGIHHNTVEEHTERRWWYCWRARVQTCFNACASEQLDSLLHDWRIDQLPAVFSAKLSLAHICGLLWEQLVLGVVSHDQSWHSNSAGKIHKKQKQCTGLIIQNNLLVRILPVVHSEAQTSSITV